MWSKTIKNQYKALRQKRRERKYPFHFESPVRIDPATKLSKNSFVGRFSYMGSGQVFGDVQVGRYCSIADGFCFVYGNHPIDHLSTHPFAYNNALFGWLDEYRDIDAKTSQPQIAAASDNPLEIGNDVWIANRVTILGKVRSIGNGSILGAGSVVTKDVPPYAIVAGNPARVLRYRFSPEVISELERLKWWELPLPAIKHLNFSDITECIVELEKIRSEAGK